MKVFCKLALVAALAVLCAAPLAAQVTVIANSGCTGSVDCGWSGDGTIGTALKVGGVGCRTGDQALVSFGIENPPIPLPGALTCLPNCVLVSSLLVNFPTDTVVVNIPLDRSLIGGCFAVSCMCVTPSPFCLSLARSLRVCVQ
jgi:hypothetical protein